MKNQNQNQNPAQKITFGDHLNYVDMDVNNQCWECGTPINLLKDSCYYRFNILLWVELYCESCKDETLLDEPNYEMEEYIVEQPKIQNQEQEKKYECYGCEKKYFNSHLFYSNSGNLKINMCDSCWMKKYLKVEPNIMSNFYDVNFNVVSDYFNLWNCESGDTY